MSEAEDIGKRFVSDHAGFRLLGSGGVLILAIWLGHCDGLADIRREACIYKTGNADCRPIGAKP